MAAPTPLTYAQVKSAMTAQGITVSDGSGWTVDDQKAYDEQFVPNVSYMKEQPDVIKANYGFVYGGEMPAPVTQAVEDAAYSVTIAATPLTGTAPLSVTATATEPGEKATSYAWDFGDESEVQTTTVPTATHSYAAAGSFTVKMTPTVDGAAKPQVSAPAPVVVSSAG